MTINYCMLHYQISRINTESPHIWIFWWHKTFHSVEMWCSILPKTRHLLLNSFQLTMRIYNACGISPVFSSKQKKGERAGKESCAQSGSEKIEELKQDLSLKLFELYGLSLTWWGFLKCAKERKKIRWSNKMNYGFQVKIFENRKSTLLLGKKIILHNKIRNYCIILNPRITNFKILFLKIKWNLIEKQRTSCSKWTKEATLLQSGYLNFTRHFITSNQDFLKCLW